MAEFVTRSIDNLSQGITVRDAMTRLGLRDKKDLLPGLEVRLLPHQAIGVAWMLDQELKSPHKGGILADEMGLGKTVQMIATMAMNLPKPNEKYRSTLIVVPAALLHQWKEELETKTNDVFNIHIHHGKDKLKKLSAVRSFDVIITTYQTLNMDFAVPSDVADDEEAEWLAENGGLLSRMQWFRIILDEAQFIRNRRVLFYLPRAPVSPDPFLNTFRTTRSSKSVALLRSKYRWMLTGTPVTNSLADIYGLIRFGRFRPWNDWNDFNEYIAKVQLEDTVLAGMRAQEVLKPVLLRRTKDAKLEGEPLLQLPKKNVDVVELEFSSEERDLYDSFEKRVAFRINRFYREGTILKKYVVMILRLRQLSCHPNLILSLAEPYSDPTLLVASDTDRERARAAQLMGQPWVDTVSSIALNFMMYSFMARARMMNFDFDDEDDGPEASCPICGDFYSSDSGRVLACGHQVCFDCLLDLRTAPIAHDGHFGEGSEQENLKAEKEYEAAVAKGWRPCPTCKKMSDCFDKVFRSSAFEPTPEEMERIQREKRQARMKRRAKSPEVEEAPQVIDLDSDDELQDVSTFLASRLSPSKDKKNVKKEAASESDSEGDVFSASSKNKGKGRAKDEDDEEEDGGAPISKNLLEIWGRGDHNVEPSTKMLALIDLLKEAEAAGDKTIVYSQWTTMLDLTELLFNRYGIRSLRYDGKMDREAREQSLMIFKKNGGPKVMLISTKCGGVGLNLVSANRVVNMDLSWNYATESQAYDRVHRLGQEKDVFVKRLIVKNTIEERMLKLQALKTELANAALGEGTGNLHKLSVKDIINVRPRMVLSRHMS
ncbi:P-loop containing nucleoside triphosphate hydrolase protein [Gloeophyllum trabeum ATCC 11539]|uniref:p-loop containing nucleoside triphosphate hydrolase protein n=1 Tax=Gloeophyllum trabeum (strain ATCC 11539 / FP-39264 / Madison 617) TaxID=670483 RepID=S7Q6R8_GLOTA|nr:P-loop containing nucleoside triphosphate hydrolase protein [Gloeophyllum trabeum ATCC 11539]EPQ55741.1 P-loop containing nucleoside triphosphate hydrolase protein [Gloeophyllum trabeum ATCC 11539]